MKDEIIELVDNWKSRHGKTDEDIDKLLNSREIFDTVNTDVDSLVMARMDNILFDIFLGYINLNSLISDFFYNTYLSYSFDAFVPCKISEEDQKYIFGEVVADSYLCAWISVEMFENELPHVKSEYKDLYEEVILPVLGICEEVYLNISDEIDYILNRVVEMKREYEKSEEGLKRMVLGLDSPFDNLSISDFDMDSDGKLIFNNNEELYRDILNVRERGLER